MRADLVALGLRLGWVAADDKEEPALAAVMERLRHEGEGVLLIFDNAIDAAELGPYLPRGGAARVLVTSNAHAWRGVAEPVEIQLWPKEIGADYLVARIGRENERAAGATLSEALGGLPLAHEQAAAYCERLGIALAEYRRRFEAAPARVLDDKRHAPAEYHDGLTVAKTFGLAIEEAAKLHPAAEPLIIHAAQLAAEPIPLFLFAEAREKFGEPLATALAGDGLDEAVAALRTFALLNRETIVDERDPTIATETVRLHRLVREVAAARRDGKARDAHRALVEAVAAVYPEAEEVLAHPKAWPRARRLDALTLALVDANITPPEGAEARVAELLHSLSIYRHRALPSYAQARSLEERALAIREKVLGPEHPDTAVSLTALGFLIERQGHLAEARPFYERALAINEKALDPAGTAVNIHNLARLLWYQGDYSGARSLQERAVASFEKALGPEHFNTFLSLCNLAGILQAQGDLAGARALHERTLTIGEKVLGPNHPHTAASLRGLAGCLQAQGDFAGARLLYERALAIYEKVLGPEHPDTADSLDSLATLLQEQGDFAGARKLHERALAIRQRVLGADHPFTAFGLNRLVSCVRAQGDIAGARVLNERALLICEKVLGPEHPATANSLSSRADLLRDQGDLGGARSLYERALEIREKVLGPGHMGTAQSLRNLAGLLNDEGDLAGARTYYERALAIFERISPEHPKTNRVRRNFARLLLATGSAAEALTFSETALTGHEKILGKNHRWTRDSAGTVADALAAIGRADEAAALYERLERNE
jgi:tetratricopeptide (TPR) repeat protein